MTPTTSHARFLRGAALSAVLSLAACTAPGGPDKIKSATFPGETNMMVMVPTPIDAGTDDVVPQQLTCTPTQSSEPLAPRSTIIGASAAPTQQVYFTKQLFDLFDKVCGGCHVENSLGDPPFVVTATTFPNLVTKDVLAVIKNDDQKTFMPPLAAGGVPFSTRDPSDPVVELATLLEIWLNAGSPRQSFTLDTSNDQPPTAGYTITPEMSTSMTNIGTCVPPKQMVATDKDAMDALDAMFAKLASGPGTLPTTLAETDLSTLDSEELAKNGVVSYAPTYPLWTDNAGKMRYVRVPRGQSIVFDKATQQLKIPANTRFYKTFLKKVIDANGNEGYRKIETRVIVSRPDTNNADGTATQNAVFGTYVWNDDESAATLLNDPLRDGKPFADRIFPYVIDEQKAQAIIDQNPKNLLDTLSQAGLTRNYALPGSERCVQCHMGSPSQSFILGFTALQVARRATGTGGIYEPAPGMDVGPDELTQLQRLIDYGVITGMTSPADVLPLEQSEGTRKPRTPQELNAQAYMVGNCAHCHNARGLPSIKQPLLKDILVFLPGPGNNQGIFEMPFDLQSPIRKRGLFQDVPINYITPSLYDLPRDSTIDKFFCPAETYGSCGYMDMPDALGNDSPRPIIKFVLAPWRSLIYRNVDTPYDYFDDYAIFPHMPFNSPGYDCRVAKLMGDWMVSLPGKIKDLTTVEGAFPGWDNTGQIDGFGPKANRDPQPYAEVKPGDADFATAMDDAKARLDQYHGSYRYNFCPDIYTADIVDPSIQDEAANNSPVTSDTHPFYDPMDAKKMVMPGITPIRPHFVSFDDTDPPGPWFPRRPDWEKALVNADIPTFVANAAKSEGLPPDDAADLQNVLEALTSVRYTDEARKLLLTEVPFGLWDTSTAGCSFQGIPTVSSFTSQAQHPHWMDLAKPDGSAPVYVESPGAAVFTTICFNCHGPNADSKGLLADEITNLTGGAARVANFRDGIFGPVGQPGANREAIFGPDAGMLGLQTDDLAARYMAWMALGGTSKHLPQDVLTQVSEAPVLGKLRGYISNTGTPDMLRLGLTLCSQIATSSGDTPSIALAELVSRGDWDWSQHTGLVDTNGDAEMWLRLCALGNRPLVHVASNNLATHHPGQWAADTLLTDFQVDGFDNYYATDDQGKDVYGPNPVMDQYGNIVNGITPDNLYPLCVPKPASMTERAIADQFLAAHTVRGNVIPYCPPGLLLASQKLQIETDGFVPNYVDGRKWAARGAINAALAVFLYLDNIERNPTARKPFYNQCQLLKPTP
jgi:mono/diheme cytochrome c family protein